MKTETELDNLDFDKICRICLLQYENMQSLFSSRAIEYFVECAAVQAAPNDGLPQTLCDICVASLQHSYNFKKKIESSDQSLRTFLSEKSVASTNDSSESEDFNSNRDDLSDSYDKPEEEKSNITPRKREKPRKNAEMDAALAKLMASAPNPMKKGQNDCHDCTCHVCQKKFSCKGQLTRHLKTHTGIRSHICDACGKAYMESGSLRKHFLSKHTGRDKPHKCPECNQGFDLRSTLIRHVRTHTGEKPFGCEFCHRFYPSKSYLNKHKKSHFGKREKPFICEICSKSFSLKDGLKAHLVTHSNERPYRCSLCDKTFSMKGSLQSHIKYIHTKEKDFMCQVCAKAFVTKCELNEHMRRHTGQKREPKHPCTMCNKKLSSSTHLKLHIRSEHTGERPYHCEFCPKAFITAQALKIHRRYHTGERPYSCGYCGKGFVTNESLKVHERIHTGERPYICTLCNSSFTQSSTLKTHMKSH